MRRYYRHIFAYLKLDMPSELLGTCKQINSFDNNDLAAAIKLGLEMNRSKCEVIGHTNTTRKLFVDHNVDLPETSSSTVIMLGSPLSTGQHLDDKSDDKKQQ
jgi:hypothetical protein